VQHAEGEWLSYVRDAYKLLPGYRSTRENAAALIMGSRATWEQFEGYHDRCVYIPENAIDPERFPGVAPKFEDGPLRVAFVGRLVPYKGADMLIEAAAPLVREGKVTIDIIGDGPEMQRLRELRRDLGVEAGVLLDGWVPHDQLRDRLMLANVLGFPSVREFGGGVVLEAMAAGLVPIVVDYAGPSELVTPETGIRVPLSNREGVVTGFRAALTHLLDAPHLISEFSEKARKRVLSAFTWQKKAEQTLEVYRWVLGERDKPDFGMPFPDIERPVE
jgi:glycosyltransferase involved in cell wall biosynthesis